MVALASEDWNVGYLMQESIPLGHGKPPNQTQIPDRSPPQLPGPPS